MKINRRKGINELRLKQNFIFKINDEKQMYIIRNKFTISHGCGTRCDR